MSKKAIFFIDANNWYHNVKKWVRPGDIDIQKLVEFISLKNELDILEIRWYASMPDMKENPLIYQRQRRFLSSLEKKGIKVITRKLQRLSNKELRKKREEFIESWSLCPKCKSIVEESFLDISDHHQKEKGIDVWIAIDIVKKAIEGVGSIVLISGDADFVPAFNLVRQVGSDVLSCSVPRGYSYELREKFPFMIFSRDIINKCLRDVKDEK